MTKGVADTNWFCSVTETRNSLDTQPASNTDMEPHTPELAA
jgi:hypothetical protein